MLLRAAAAARRLPSARAGWVMHLSTAPPDDPPAGSWMPRWLRSRVPTALGGDKEADLTLDEYAKQLARARKLSAVTGFAAGAPVNAGVRGALRQYEAVIAAITADHHRRDPAAMTAADRADVAARAGVPVSVVDDTVAKFVRVKALGEELARRKAAGEPLPTTVAELEATVGSVGAAPGAVAAPKPAPGQAGVAATATAPDGRPCPFRGLAPARNAVCAVTKKKYKQCCGK